MYVCIAFNSSYFHFSPEMVCISYVGVEDECECVWLIGLLLRLGQARTEQGLRGRWFGDEIGK